LIESIIDGLEREKNDKRLTRFSFHLFGVGLGGVIWFF
jgi:hypothetical protein